MKTIKDDLYCCDCKTNYALICGDCNKKEIKTKEQEVLKQPFLLLQKALAELRTQKFFVKTLGAGRDVVLVSDIDKIEKKWLEEKQKKAGVK